MLVINQLNAAYQVTLVNPGTGYAVGVGSQAGYSAWNNSF